MTKDGWTEEAGGGKDLRHELSVATALARRAGAMLLEEFHRPGGARGDGPDHAEVDGEVEELLRAEFGREFPGETLLAAPT